MTRLCVVVAGAALVLVTIGAERRAAACSCVSARIEVVPAGKAPAPVDSHVWIYVPSHMPRSLRGPNSHKIDHRKLTIEIRDGDGGIVPLGQRRDVRSGHVHVVELISKTEFRADTKYQVTMLLKTGAQVIGEFTTGSRRAATAPQAKLVKATYGHRPARCCDCSTGYPYIHLSVKHSAATAVYGVWMTTSKGGHIDFSKPPTAYVRPHHGTVTLGSASTCSAATAVLQPGVRGYRVGLVPIDLAGNCGATIKRFVKATTNGKYRSRKRPGR